MSHQYYYFAASLPMLTFEGKTPMSTASFLEDCQRFLSRGDCDLMRQLLADGDIDVKAGPHVFNAWAKFDRNFRNELAWYRAVWLSKDPLKYIHGERLPDPQLAEVIHQASRMTNLWEAEKFLDKARWMFLEDLAAGHYFDIEFLFVYGLKLRILERHHEYASRKGKEIFMELRQMELSESCVLDPINRRRSSP